LAIAMLAIHFGYEHTNFAGSTRFPFHYALYPNFYTKEIAKTILCIDIF